MAIALISGACGLVGSAAAQAFDTIGMDVVGIDNDMRSHFFGKAASTAHRRTHLENSLRSYTHHDLDIRSRFAVESLFKHLGPSVEVVVHTAGQPSHDWAATDPFTDFTVNANGTLNLLEMTRYYSPYSSFLFTSTNKVYGSRPNELPLKELPSRWELDASHPYFADGVPETMSIDETLHSLFGVSKLAADILVQEYGRYFALNTATFRAGCITGAAHAATKLHGFLAFLVRSAVAGDVYNIIGHKGKQVRDVIHASDLADALVQTAIKPPRPGQVYNIGGGRSANCSIQEAVCIVEATTGKPIITTLAPEERIGDHSWWISDCSRFRTDYPTWTPIWTIEAMVAEIADAVSEETSAA